MIDEKQVMPLNYFAYGGIYSGQHEKMKYRLLRTGEKPDYSMEAACWRGPYGYDAVMRGNETADKIKRASFTFDEQGRKEAIEWLKKEYEQNENYYEEAPEIIFAPIDLDKIYS